MRKRMGIECKMNMHEPGNINTIVDRGYNILESKCVHCGKTIIANRFQLCWVEKTRNI